MSPTSYLVSVIDRTKRSSGTKPKRRNVTSPERNSNVECPESMQLGSPPLVFAQIKAALQSNRLYRAARFGWHFARDPIFRRDHLLLWRRPRGLFQHRSITWPNRYPAVFEFLCDQLAHVPSPRVLSFGCATGEEVFSLRQSLPNVSIKGIDINPGNIRVCEARNRADGYDPRLCFAQGASVASEPPATYDAVLCMAVFVRWSLRNRPDIATSAPPPPLFGLRAHDR